MLGVVMNDIRRPAQAWRSALNLIWLALTASLGLYWMVHLLMGTRPQAPPAGPTPLPMILALQAAVAWVVGWALHGSLVRSVSAQVAPMMIQRLGPDERLALQQRVQSSTIASLALFESGAVFGLVNSLLASAIPKLFEWLAIGSFFCLVWFRLNGFPRVIDLLEKLDVRA